MFIKKIDYHLHKNYYTENDNLKIVTHKVRRRQEAINWWVCLYLSLLLVIILSSLINL